MNHAEEDLEAASSHCIAHGSLLSLRYVLSELPWQAIAKQQGNDSQDCRPLFKAALRRIFSLVAQVARATLPVLAHYQETYLGAPYDQQPRP